MNQSTSGRHISAWDHQFSPLLGNHPKSSCKTNNSNERKSMLMKRGDK